MSNPFGGPQLPLPGMNMDDFLDPKDGPHDRQDIIYDPKAYGPHGHTVLKDIDGDGELEVVYDRLPGDRRDYPSYDSGE